MARPLRLEFPGALWHVTNRGVEQRSIYSDDRDRTHFLSLLASVVADCGWILSAYVLMSNHYHLLFETPRTNLSAGMRDLDGDYASAFNVRHRRVGHLFQGRFKGHLVDSDTYLLEVARYVVLNPVRARIVSEPAAWFWSSYRSTAGLAPVPSWLTISPILDRFDPSDRQTAAREYREFVSAAIGGVSSPWEHLVAQLFLGGASFRRRIEQRVRRRELSAAHPRPQRRFRATTLGDIEAAMKCCFAPRSWREDSTGRMLFALLAERLTDSSHAAIGRQLELTGPGALYLIRCAGRRRADEPQFRALLRAMEESLTSDDDPF